MPSEANTARAKDLLPFNSHREPIAEALDAAEQRGRESVEAELRRLRERIAKMAEREERYRQDATQRLDDLDAASYDRSARVLRSLLVAEKEG